MGSPEKTVINIAGDGCFRMNLNELATATRYNIPIIEVIINNSVLGMVRQWQNLFYSEHYSYNDLRGSGGLCEGCGRYGCAGETGDDS